MNEEEKKPELYVDPIERTGKGLCTTYENLNRTHTSVYYQSHHSLLKKNVENLPNSIIIWD